MLETTNQFQRCVFSGRFTEHSPFCEKHIPDFQVAMEQHDQPNMDRG